MRPRRRMEHTWSDFWTTRGRSSFLSPRRAARPQRRPYEVLGASRSTKPARSFGESNITYINLEAGPSLIDFRESFDFGFPCHSACVLLQSPFFVSPPPRHAGGPQEVLTVVCLIIAPFFVSSPRHAGDTRKVFDGGLP